MKTITLLSIILFFSIQCRTTSYVRNSMLRVSVDTIEENEVYVNFSHDSLFLSYYFSDPEGVQDAVVDSVVIEVPKFGKSMKVVTDRSPIHSRLFLGKVKNHSWSETPIVVFFYKDGFKTDKFDLKL